MDIVFEPPIIKGYECRQLVASDDLPLINRFCEVNRDYFDFENGVEGYLRAGRDTLEGLPPGKVLDDKYVIGVFDQTRMIALIDLIQNYPTNSICFLGLFIIDVSLRELGVGQKIYNSIEQAVVASYAKKMRLAVIESNKIGVRFWEKVGYIKIDRKESKDLGVKHQLIVMEKRLS